jgi:hypothetical protein
LLAEVLYLYSNFRIPEVPHLPDAQPRDEVVTLTDQAEGRSSLLLAEAGARPATAWKSTRPHQGKVVRLYEDGHSLTSIAKQVGIAWDSVARLLDRAGVRERKNKSR